jgi:hypothetical protein
MELIGDVLIIIISLSYYSYPCMPSIAVIAWSIFFYML